MKRLVAVMMMVVVMMVACTSVAMADTKGTVKSTRVASGKVVQMCECDDTEEYIEVLIKTTDDNYWTVVVDKDTDLRVLTKVRVTFKTKGTQRKSDDVITKVVIK